MKKKLFKKIILSVVGGHLFAGLFILLIICCIVTSAAAAGAAKQKQDEEAAGSTTAKLPLSDSVENYRTYVEESTKKFGIPDWVNLVLAIMQQESRGEGTDVMQSSKCGYNILYKGETIPDPYYSIDCGVQNIRDALKQSQPKNVDDTQNISLALQGYNFGLAYILWAQLPENGGGYDHDKAVAYSAAQLQQHNEQYKDEPEKQWTIYGDVDYPEHVLRYYTTSNVIIPAGVLPLDSGYVFPVFNNWRLSQGYSKSHLAVDIAAPKGTFVLAVQDGTVTWAQEWDGKSTTGNQSYGNCIDITSTDGKTRTRYAHLDKMVVKNGDPVKQGQLIGYIGTTGNSSGYHLHFEYLPYLPDRPQERADPTIILTNLKKKE